MHEYFATLFSPTHDDFEHSMSDATLITVRGDNDGHHPPPPPPRVLRENSRGIDDLAEALANNELTDADKFIEKTARVAQRIEKQY